MARPLILDSRNIFSRATIAVYAFEYVDIGSGWSARERLPDAKTL
jgi:hypothetical protein